MILFDNSDRRISTKDTYREPTVYGWVPKVNADNARCLDDTSHMYFIQNNHNSMLGREEKGFLS